MIQRGPTNFRMVGSTHDSITFAWEPSPGGMDSGYVLQRGYSQNRRYRVPPARSRMVSYTAGGLPPSVAWSWLLYAQQGSTLVGTDRAVLAGTDAAPGPAADPHPGSEIVGIGPAYQGYWLLWDDGLLQCVNGAARYDVPPHPSQAAAVDLAVHPSGHGFWLLLSSGLVLAGGNPTWGAGQHYGSPPGGESAALDYVAIAATPSGRGYYTLKYWGEVHVLGDARYFGAPREVLARYTGVSVRSDGQGYLIADALGHVEGFGAWEFRIPPPNPSLQPYLGVTLTPSNSGFWLVPSRMTAGLQPFGDASRYTLDPESSTYFPDREAEATAFYATQLTDGRPGVRWTFVAHGEDTGGNVEIGHLVMVRR
jgi:hypothetical protein